MPRKTTKPKGSGGGGTTPKGRAQKGGGGGGTTAHTDRTTRSAARTSRSDAAPGDRPPRHPSSGKSGRRKGPKPAAGADADAAAALVGLAAAGAAVGGTQPGGTQPGGTQPQSSASPERRSARGAARHDYASLNSNGTPPPPSQTSSGPQRRTGADSSAQLIGLVEKGLGEGQGDSDSPDSDVGGTTPGKGTHSEAEEDEEEDDEEDDGEEEEDEEEDEEEEEEEEEQEEDDEQQQQDKVPEDFRKQKTDKMTYDYSEKVALLTTIIDLGGGKMMLNRKFSFNNEYGVVSWYNEIIVHVVRALKKNENYMKTSNGRNVRKRFGKRRMKTVSNWWKGQVTAQKRAQREGEKQTGASGGREAPKPRYLTELRDKALSTDPAVNPKDLLKESKVGSGGRKRRNSGGSSGRRTLNLETDGIGGESGEKKKKRKKTKGGGVVDVTGDASGESDQGKPKKPKDQKGKGKATPGANSRGVGGKEGGEGEKEKPKKRKNKKGKGKATPAAPSWDSTGSESEDLTSENDTAEPPSPPASESGDGSSSDSEDDSDASSRDGGGRSKSRRRGAFDPKELEFAKNAEKGRKKESKERTKHMGRVADCVENMMGGGGGDHREKELVLEERKVKLEELKTKVGLCKQAWEDAVKSNQAGTGATDEGVGETYDDYRKAVKLLNAALK